MILWSERKPVRYLIVFLLGLAIAINVGFVAATWSHLLDFGSFLAAGQAVRDGGDPYAATSPLVFRVAYEQLGVGGDLVNLNPPLTVLVFSLLSASEPLRTVAIWRIVSVALYAVSLALLRRWLPRRTTWALYLWAFALAGFWHSVELGQIYVLLVFVLVLQVRAEAIGRTSLAGALIGLLAAIKPNFLLWILTLIAARQWKLAWPAAASFLGLSLLPAALLGADIYSQWFSATAIDPAILALPGNSSLAGLTVRLGSYAAGLVVAGLVGLAFLAALWRTAQTPPQLTTQVGLLLSLMCAPIAWTGYTILLAPTLLARSTWTPVIRWGAAFLAVPFVIPLLQFTQSGFAFVFWGWFYGWAILLLVVQAWLDIRARRGAAIPA